MKDKPVISDDTAARLTIIYCTLYPLRGCERN